MNAKILIAIACTAAVSTVWCLTTTSRTSAARVALVGELPSDADDALRTTLDAALPERISVQAVGEPLDVDATNELFAEIARAARETDPRALEPLLSRWLESVPYPIETSLSLFDRLDDDQGRSQAVGLLLQSAMLFATDLPTRDEPWTRERLAREILARADSSPLAAQVCRTAVAGFAADVPPDELPSLIARTASPDLVHRREDAVLERLVLIRELGKGMSEAVVPLLVEQIADAGQETRACGFAATALMDRDWRSAVPHLLEVLRDGNPLPSANATEVRAALSGRYIELHGRDRIELVRELVADEEVARIALCNLPLEQAQELDAAATPEDRKWPEFEWVEFTLGGERGYRAGLALVDRLGGKRHQAYAAQVLADLLRDHLGEPELTSRLDQRFAERRTASDPYWGALASVAHRVDEATLYGEILPRLEASMSELSGSRKYLIDTLHARFPELGLTRF